MHLLHTLSCQIYCLVALVVKSAKFEFEMCYHSVQYVLYANKFHLCEIVD
jgi:hypothetical protein